MKAFVATVTLSLLPLSVHADCGRRSLDFGQLADMHAFETLDCNQDGLIDARELDEFWFSAGVDEATVAELIDSFDTDGDRLITLSEFPGPEVFADATGTSIAPRPHGAGEL